MTASCRKTGVAVKENVKKDWSQLDDLDDFWAEEESTRRLQLSYHTDAIDAIAGKDDNYSDHTENDHYHDHDHDDYDDDDDDAVNQGQEEVRLAEVVVVKKKVMVEVPPKTSPGSTRKEKLEQLEMALGIVSPTKLAPHSALKRQVTEAERDTENIAGETSF